MDANQDRLIDRNKSEDYLNVNALFAFFLIVLIFVISQFWNTFAQQVAARIWGVDRLEEWQNLVVAIVLSVIFLFILLQSGISVVLFT